MTKLGTNVIGHIQLTYLNIVLWQKGKSRNLMEKYVLNERETIWEYG